MPRGLIVGLLLWSLWPAEGMSGQGVDTLVISLAEAEERALQSSPLLKGATAELELTRAQEIRAGHARYIPEFTLRNVSGVLPRQRGEYTETGVLFSPDTALGVGDLRPFTQIDVRVLQPLYSFGKISNRIDAVGYGVEASQAGLAKTEADVLLLVRQLYWGVVLGNELQRVVENLQSNVAEAEEKLQQQVEEGTATQNDEFKFQLFQYEVNRRAREVEAGLTAARAGLGAAMGVEGWVPLKVATTELTPLAVTLDSLEAYLAMARSSRPELRQLEAGIAARSSLLRAVERDSWPTLFLAGGLSINQAPWRVDPRNPFWQNQTNYFRGSLFVGLDWNLNFLGNRDEARIRRREVAQLEAQINPLQAKVEQEVREAWLKATRAQADVEDGRRALQASDNWLRAEMQTFDIGIGAIKDVIDAFQANVAMESQQLKNIADFNTALAELSRRVGRDITLEPVG